MNPATAAVVAIVLSIASATGTLGFASWDQRRNHGRLTGSDGIVIVLVLILAFSVLMLGVGLGLIASVAWGGQP